MEIIIQQKVQSFILSLEPDAKKKIARDMDLLEKYSYLLGMPNSKRLHNNLYELRIRGQQEVRLFYCFYNGGIYMVHGIIKKTEKLPRREFKIALKNSKKILD